MHLKSVLLCLLLIWLSNSVHAQIEPGMPNEPGKCYAKCLMADQYITEYKLLPKYTGPPVDTLTNSSLIALHFTPQAGGTKWEKGRADKNCLSSNPDDCLVWCLVDSPAIDSIDFLVVDTLLTPTYEWHQFPNQKLIKKGGYSEWLEVVCESDLNPKFFEKLQKALLENGYYNGEVDGKFNKDLKRAISLFQKEEGQAVGGLDLESMKALGVIK